ncbi:MAG TPA: F0F1 ATP synthase subunit epsilon [Gammaproteobacteria bacterium]|nr:F0F1 ATP synthase subunit epsilon [Gammaproteobacteria bacterium]
MANTIQVDIVSAEEQIYSGEAYMVYAPAVMGELGIAPRHTPLISPLKPGEIRLDVGDGKEEFFFISGGILEVQPHLVTVLSDTAIRADDLDEAAALEAKKRAEAALVDQKSDLDVAKARAELAAAAAQIAAIKKLRRK